MSAADWAVILYCNFLSFAGGVGLGLALGLIGRRALSEQEKGE